MRVCNSPAALVERIHLEGELGPKGEPSGKRNNEAKTKVLIKAQSLMDNSEFKGEKPIPQYTRIWSGKQVQLLSG